MGFKNTDKKTAQEVPLLFQGSALILLYVQIYLGRHQPQRLPAGLAPRGTKPEHTCNSLPVSPPGGTDEWVRGTPFFFPTVTPTPESPQKQRLSPAPTDLPLCGKS